MSESKAVQKARAEFEAVKRKLGEKPSTEEFRALILEYDRLCRFIYYRQGRPSRF